MNRNAVYIRVLLIIVAVAAFLAFTDRSPHRATQNAWLPSTFNPAQDGTMALYQTLSDLHWPVERWREPLGRLPNLGTGNILVVTRSPVGWRVAFSEDEAALLASWVAQGNTLFLLGPLDQWEDTRDLLRAFGFALPGQPQTAPLDNLFSAFQAHQESSLELQPGPANPGAAPILIPAGPPLPLVHPPLTRVLWQTDGAPYVLDFPSGGGRVIVASSAAWLSNRDLDRGDNLRALLGLLAPGGVAPQGLIFEESHHGYSAIFALVHLWDNPGLRVGGMLALLGLFAFLGSSFVRFGPVLPHAREAGRSTLEFVDSIADLYQRADVRNALIDYLFTETHRSVLQRLHLPATAPHDVIAARLAQSHPQLPSWKKLARRFDSREHLPGRYTSGLPPSGWFRTALELIEIKSAMT